MATAVESTETLFTLALPDPEARLQIGSGEVPGVSGEASDHVRLRADGGPAHSDVVAQATGQLWLSAVSNAAFLAKKKLMVSAQGASWLAADRGINVLAGFRPRGAIASKTAPGELPEGVEGYEDTTEVVSGIWTGFTVALGVSIAAAKVAESVVGTQFSWSQSLGANLNLGGAALNLANLTGKRDVRLPGIGLWSQGGTRIGSTFNSVNVMGVGGVTLASPFTTLLGLSTARVHAIQRVGLTSCGDVDIAGLCGGSIKSFLSTTVAARTGSLTLIGSKSMAVGVPHRPPTEAWPLTVLHRGVSIPNPQQLTQTVQLSALRHASITGQAGVSLNAPMGSARITAVRSTTVAAPKVTLTTVLGRLEAEADDNELTFAAGPTSLALEQRDVTFESGVNELSLNARTISIKRGTLGSIAVEPAKSMVSFNAPQLAIK